MGTSKKNKKKVTYKKNVHPKMFLEMCNKGYTLTQIANEIGAPKEQLVDWANPNQSRRKYEWEAAWIKGLQAAQAYHESRYMEMCTMQPSPPAQQIKAYEYFMKTQFPKDWAEKPKKVESEISMRVEETLTPKQLEDQLKAKSKKFLKLIHPELEVIEGGKK